MREVALLRRVAGVQPALVDTCAVVWYFLRAAAAAAAAAAVCCC